MAESLERKISDEIDPLISLSKQGFPFYRNLVALYSASAMASSAIIELSRLLAHQDIANDAGLVLWNCALSGLFGFFERYQNRASAQLVNHEGASFILGPAYLAVSFTLGRYAVLGRGLDYSGAGTLYGVLVGGLAGFFSSWQAWRVARRGEEVGVKAIFGEPIRKIMASVREHREPALIQLQELYVRRVLNKKLF